MNKTDLWLLQLCAEQKLGQRQVKSLCASSESSEIWNSKSINRSVFTRRVQGFHGSLDALRDELTLH